MRVRRYEVAKKKGDYDEEAQKREQAKNALERYMHYYQRWAENDKSRVAALKAMRTVIEQKLEQLSELTATPTSQLKFLPDAWAQVGSPSLNAISCCFGLFCVRVVLAHFGLDILGCHFDELGLLRHPDLPPCCHVASHLQAFMSSAQHAYSVLLPVHPTMGVFPWKICQCCGCAWVRK